MPLQPNDVLANGQYRIVRQLGRGGFGYVYLAEDTLLHEDIAIKELIPALIGDEAMLKRFLAEAKATMKLAHDSIVRTHNVFSEHDNFYIAMEYMRGGSLESVLQAKTILSVDQATRLGIEVAEGLAYAHQHGVVHCDLKPANILLDKAGHAKVADFGIAHVSGLEMTRTWQTPVGFVAGTLPYMSPEQADGVRDDPRIDVYALGAVLYRALAGQPYLDFEQRETPGAQADNVYRIRHEAPTPPSQYNPHVPPWLDAVLLTALAKQPADRLPSAAAFREALVGQGATMTSVVQPGAATRAAPPAWASATFVPTQVVPQERRGLPAWLVVVIVAMGMLAVGSLAWLALTGGPGTEVALAELPTRPATVRPADTNTPAPVVVPTVIIPTVLIPTDTPLPTDTPVPPTDTPVPPTDTPAPTLPPPPTDIPVVSDCPGALTQLVALGDTAYVATLSDPLLMHQSPGYTATQIDRLQPGTRMVITEGPACADGRWWWKVRTDTGTLGWVVEGSDDVDPRFILPVDTSPPTPAPQYQIAYHTNQSGNWDIWIMNPDGSGQRQVYATGLDEFPYAWSSVTGELLYTQGPPVKPQNRMNEAFSLTLSTGQTRALTTDLRNISGADWSPDGQRVVISSNHRLNLAPQVICNIPLTSAARHDILILDGAMQIPLVLSGTTPNGYPACGTTSPTWSPDGRYIAFAMMERSGSPDAWRDTWNIYRMNTDGSGVCPLAGGGNWHNESPSWSPDGRLVAYMSNRGSQSKYGLYVMPATCDPSVAPIAVALGTVLNSQGPRWSPDGTQIAFTVFNSAGSTDIYVVDVDRQGHPLRSPRRITSGARSESGPVWVY